MRALGWEPEDSRRIGCGIPSAHDTTLLDDSAGASHRVQRRRSADADAASAAGSDRHSEARPGHRRAVRAAADPRRAASSSRSTHPARPSSRRSRVREAEVYNVSQTVPGRINSIVNIHNPSIEFHPTERYLNTGAVVILVAGGGHNSLNRRQRGRGLRALLLPVRREHRHPAQSPAPRRLQRARPTRCTTRSRRSASCARTRRQWNLDPNRIGIIGFSAGAELSAPSALSFEEFDRKNAGANDPFAGVSSRPDFVGIIYPGPTPFSVRNPTGPSTSAARNPSPPPIPRNAPPAFMATAGSGDRIHALWAMDYAYAMLDAGVPNVEIHVYGNGRHPGDSLSDGGRMTGGLSAANTPTDEHVAVSLHRLVARPRLPAEAGRGDEGGDGTSPPSRISHAESSALRDGHRLSGHRRGPLRRGEEAEHHARPRRCRARSECSSASPP